jgi:hypothetical protein
MDEILSAGTLATGELDLTPEGRGWLAELHQMEMHEGQSPADWAADLVLSTNGLTR